MTRYLKIPNVHLSDKGANRVINITFKDPRELDSKGKPKQKVRSTKTKDPERAIKIAFQVSDILRSRAFDDPPPDTYAITLSILNIKRKEDASYEKLEKDFWDTTTLMRDGPPSYEEIVFSLPINFSNEDTDSLELEVQLLLFLTSQFEEIKKLKGRIHNLNASLLEARNENEALSAQLIATGQVKAKYGQLSLEQAIKNFLSHDKAVGGTGARKPRWRKTVEQYLNVFKEYIGEQVKLKDITPSQITAFLSKKLKTAKPKSVKQIGNQIVKMLRHQTKGTLTATIEEVREWMRVNCRAEEKSEFYWPSPKDIEALLKFIKDESTLYWHDAAIIQYGCGFRPEEIPFLQKKHVSSKGEVSTVRVDNILNERGELYWSPKNTHSIDTVRAPSFAKEALSRRLASSSIVLFPRDRSECGGSKQRNYKNAKQFEIKNKLWKPDIFCQRYIKVLRKAAVKAGLEEKRIDSRTLRRVCGKEILLETGSYEKAAAVLRNDPETCRRWYAQFKAPDVSTERETAVGKKPSRD